MKRAWTCSRTLRPHKKKKTLSSSSRIEKLLDDILLLILSHLTFAEAARTSLLSYRWAKLWCSLPNLYFENMKYKIRGCGSITITKYYSYDLNKSKGPRKCCLEFVERVHRVLEARFPGFTLTGIKFQHELHPSLRTHVDNWFRFAVANKVEYFHLDLMDTTDSALLDQYTLKVEDWFKTPSAFANFKCLRSLAIKYVILTREFVDFILSTCQLLETLDLASTGEFTGLEISGSLVRLRCLIISVGWGKVELAKLSAPNLTRFKYDGKYLGLQTAEVPKLVDLHIGGGNCYLHPPIKNFLLPFWPYLSQLQKLSLTYTEYQQLEIPELPELLTLQHLTLEDTIREDDYEFPGLLNIMKACPVLQSIRVESFYLRYPKMRPADLIQDNPIVVTDDPCFRCLKEFAFQGASWKTMGLNLTRSIIGNSPNLEKLTFESLDSPKKVVSDMKKRAKTLKKVLNPGITIKIM